jgi:hypothetical protein
MEVDGDDPTCIVDTYLDTWWHDTSNPAKIPSYAYDPYDYLEIHHTQVSNILLLVLYLHPSFARFNSLGKISSHSHMLLVTWQKLH